MAAISLAILIWIWQDLEQERDRFSQEN